MGIKDPKRMWNVSSGYWTNKKTTHIIELRNPHNQLACYQIVFWSFWFFLHLRTFSFFFSPLFQSSFLPIQFIIVTNVHSFISKYKCLFSFCWSIVNPWDHFTSPNPNPHIVIRYQCTYRGTQEPVKIHTWQAPKSWSRYTTCVKIFWYNNIITFA